MSSAARRLAGPGASGWGRSSSPWSKSADVVQVLVSGGLLLVSAGGFVWFGMTFWDFVQCAFCGARACGFSCAPFFVVAHGCAPAPTLPFPLSAVQRRRGEAVAATRAAALASLHAAPDAAAPPPLK